MVKNIFSNAKLVLLFVCHIIVSHTQASGFLLQAHESFCLGIFLVMDTWFQDRQRSSNDWKLTESAKPIMGQNLWINTPAPSFSIETTLRLVLYELLGCPNGTEPLVSTE